MWPTVEKHTCKLYGVQPKVITRVGQPVSLLWALCVGELEEGTLLLSGLWRLVQEEAVSQHLPCCQLLHFLPVCHWCPSSYCLGAEAQRD